MSNEDTKIVLEFLDSIKWITGYCKTQEEKDSLEADGLDPRDTCLADRMLYEKLSDYIKEKLGEGK